MAILDWKLKDCDESSQTIFLRSDTTGTGKVTSSSGQTASVSLDTTVDDGTGTVTLSNVSDGEAFTVYFDDVAQDTGRFNLAPAEDERFTIAGFSCMYGIIQKDAAALRHLTHEPRLKIIFDDGDTPYMQNASTSFGVSYSNSGDSLTVAQDINNYYAGHLQMCRWPSFKLAHHTACYVDGYDDHEGPTNDFDHNLTNSNAAGISFVYANQGEVDTAFQAAHRAFRAYSKGNPSWDSPINQAPPDSTLADSNYNVGYFSKEFGDALLIRMDTLTSRGAHGGDVSLVNSLQLAQIKADALATNKTWIVVACPKPFMQSTNGNVDGYTFSAATEEADLMAFFSALPQGVILCGGDDHVFTISESQTPAFTSICGASISQDIKTNRIQNSTNKLLAPEFSNNYWMLDVHGKEKIECYGVNIYGDKYHAGTLLPGAKILV